MRTGQLGLEGCGEPLVLAAAAAGIVPFIEQQGGDIDRIFGHAGLAPEMAGAPTLRMSLAGFCRLFEESARQTQNDNFGLWFGQQFQPRDLGLWGYAALTSPTLGDALRTLVELFPLHQERSTMRLAEAEGGLIRLEYRIEAADIRTRRQDAELSLGMFQNVMREGLGTWTAIEEVHFEHPKPEDWHAHRRAFGAPVYFSQPINALIFRRDGLSKPMPARDPRLRELMRSCLERLARRADLKQTLLDRVRMAVRSALPEGGLALEEVSTALRVTPGAIHRDLASAGTTYKELIETTRRELALDYLERGDLPLTEIAALVGYSELSALSRAVRRWTGQSPRAYRRRISG
ncbi:MAG: AraC family transcriptional regulator [Hyphomicrobiaceae bacterium]